MERIASLSSIGERFHGVRAHFMVETSRGLTSTYNLIKDPACVEPQVAELRLLHEELDRAVLTAYGWSDIGVPPYASPTTEAQKKALETFEDEVIDRLFALNAERAEQEKLLGTSSASKSGKTSKKKRTGAADQPQLALGGVTPPKPRRGS